MNTTPALHFMCGKAGAGKSTLAQALAIEHNAILICEDVWMARLFPVLAPHQACRRSVGDRPAWTAIGCVGFPRQHHRHAILVQINLRRGCGTSYIASRRLAGPPVSGANRQTQRRAPRGITCCVYGNVPLHHVAVSAPHFGRRFQRAHACFSKTLTDHSLMSQFLALLCWASFRRPLCSPMSGLNHSCREFPSSLWASRTR